MGAPALRSVAWSKLGSARTVHKLREGLALLARLARHPAFLYANPAEKACDPAAVAALTEGCLQAVASFAKEGKPAQVKPLRAEAHKLLKNVGHLALEKPEVRAACTAAKVTSAVGALEGKGGAAQQIVHLQKIWAQVDQSKKREAASANASPKRRKVGQP